MSDSEDPESAYSLGRHDDVQPSDDEASELSDREEGNAKHRGLRNDADGDGSSSDCPDDDKSDDGKSDSDASMNQAPFETFPMFSSLNPPSPEDKPSESDDEGSEGSPASDDQLSLPALRVSISPDVAATPTPAPKRRAQYLNGSTPVAKRRKTRRTQSNPFVDLEEEFDATLPRDESRLQRGVDTSGHSADSSSRKQKSKPTFAQTPLNFKPEQRKSGKRSTAKSIPSPSTATPRTPSRLSKSSPGSRLRTPGANYNFTMDERVRLADTVEQFRLQYDLSTIEVNDLIQENLKEGDRHRGLRSRLWGTIFAVLPGKERHKVLSHCRKNFHNFKARGGNWTAEEEEQLALLVETHGQTWAKFSKVLNRHPEDLRDRYRNYTVCGDQRETNAWTEEELDQLVDFVQEAMDELRMAKELEPENKRFRQPIEKQINWVQISNRFSRRRSRLQCLQRWRKIGSF